MTEERTDEATEFPSCYRHPGRETYIRCQRCERHVCPDCQRQASVGVHCVDCVREAAKEMPTARTRFGGVLRPGGAIVTKILIGLNVGIFLLVQVLPDSFWGSTALLGYEVYDGEYWRLLTSAFLQIGMFHLLINMVTLWVLGPPLEAVLGRLRFVGLYLLAGLAGSAAAYAFTAPYIPVVGASGALAGLFGATLVLARRLRWDVSWLVGVLVINVIINVMAREALSWQGHLGGLVGGLLLGVALAYTPAQPWQGTQNRPDRRRDLVQGIGFAGVAVATALLVVWRNVELTAVLIPVG